MVHRKRILTFSGTMSDAVRGYWGHDRRVRHRFRLPGRAALGWLVAGLESLVILGLLWSIAGVGALPGALGWLLLSYPVWYHRISAPTQRLNVPATAGLAWAVVYPLAVLIAYAAGMRPSWTAIAGAAVVGLAAGCALRMALSALIGRFLEQGRFQLERVGVVGEADDVGAFVAHARAWTLGLQPVMLFASGASKGDDLTDFIARCVAARCDRIMFVSVPAGLGRERLSDLCKRYYVDADFVSIPFDPRDSERIAERPVGFTGTVVKRVFDIAASALLLLALSPLLLATALLIRLESPGPALFRQERMGFNGRSFMIYKFRSMRVMEDGRSMRQARKNDSRITRIGRVLRASSIDELPQLLNVLRGDMSLIGPRPHAVSHDSEMERMVASYAHRNRIRPGISGWAQVNGFRGDTSTREKIEGRVAHDLYYIENWSLLLDLYIVFLTVFSRRTRQNAY